tara:strand:- start:17 stop:694 length:678 start_codon:yes stop_codon:yes gene_type:complete
MNVTKEINTSILQMGGSGSHLPANYASSKTLNFAKDSATIQNARTEPITAIPRSIYYSDTVGLFGAENVFVKVDLNIQNSTGGFTNIETPENDYFPVWISDETGTTNSFDTAVMDFTKDKVTVNDFQPARISNDLSQYNKPYISIKLENLKTGNKWIDSYFDVRLYTKNREEFAYDEMFISIKDYFYIGFHARNTKRLPYNVRLDIGLTYKDFYELTPAERKLVA